MCLYFTLEFRIWLELFNVSVGFKTCPCWICYECVQFQIEIRKISGCGHVLQKRRMWSFHVVVFQRTAKKCTKNYNARAHLLFCGVLVAVAVVFCVRSLMLHARCIDVFLGMKMHVKPCSLFTWTKSGSQNRPKGITKPAVIWKKK